MAVAQKHPEQKHLEIGTALRGWRDGRKLSRERVAVAAGVTAQTIYAWERGRTPPDLIAILRAERALGGGLCDALREVVTP